jgi:hypothetical protein
MSQSRPEMRASDRERQETVRALRGQLRDGRLSDVTFVGRLLLALDARRRTELDVLVADLPMRPPANRRLTPLYRRFTALLTRLNSWPLVRPGRWPIVGRSAPGISELALPPVPGEYVIGRAHDVDLHLDDISVSRRHAVIVHVCGGWVLTDLGSRNGTWLNGWRLPGPAPVSPGDLLHLGSCRFVVVDGPARLTGTAVGPVASRAIGR